MINRRLLLAVTVCTGLVAAWHPGGGPGWVMAQNATTQPSEFASEDLYEGLSAEGIVKVKAGDWDGLLKVYQYEKAENLKGRTRFWLGYANYRAGMSTTVQPRKWLRAARNLLAAHMEQYPGDYQAARVLAEIGITWPSLTTTELAHSYFPSDPHLNRLLPLTAVASYLQYTSPPHRFMNEEQAKRHLDLRERYREEAIRYLQQARWKGEESQDIDRWLGRMHLDLDQYIEAVRDYERALVKGPLDWAGHLEYAKALVMSDQLEEGQQALKVVLGYLGGSNKSRAVACVEFGEVCMEAGYYLRAVEAFQAALDYDINIRRARGLMAEAALKEGDYETALWAFNQSYRIDDQKASGLFGMAKTLHHLERDERALLYLEAALKEMGKDGKKFTLSPEQKHYQGRILWENGKRKEALPLLREAFNEERSNLTYAMWLYQCGSSMGDLYLAIDTAYFYGREGDAERGIEAIKAILKKWPRPRFEDFKAKRIPHPVFAHQRLGQLYYKLGQYQAATYHFRKARRDRGRTVVKPAAYAEIFAGNPDRAIRAFQDLAKIQKDEKEKGRALYGLSMAYVQKEDAEKALATIQQVKEESMRWRYRNPIQVWAQKKLAESSSDNGPIEMGWLDQLGVVPSSMDGTSKGTRVLMLLPGSPFLELERPLKRGDYILEIDGRSVGYWKHWEALNREGIQKETVPVKIRRGDLEMIMDMDVSKIQKPNLPAPEIKEEG